MIFQINDLRKLEAGIKQIAQQQIMPRYEKMQVELKADGSVLTEADLAVQQALVAMMQANWPQFAILAEEMTETEQMAMLQQTEQGLCLIDPIDGTSNFASGIPYFAISIALLFKGQVIAGVVYDPTRDESFSALAGQGAWLNGERLSLSADQPTDLSSAMVMLDLKRLPPALFIKMSEAMPFRSQRSYGSVALDWCWLAKSRVQLYLHGGQRLWDFAAGRLVYKEAGGFGDVYEDYQGNLAEQWDLNKKIAIAATSEPLLQAWKDWVRV